MTNSSDALPERFVYICSASDSREITRAPLRDFSDRVVGVVVMLGLSERAHGEPRSPTLHDEKMREAAKRLILQGHHEIGLERDRIEMVDGRADFLEDWTGVMAVAARIASGETAPGIVLNISPGTKPMALGALLGHDRTMPPLKLISISHEQVTSLIEFGQDGPRTAPLPRKSGESFAEFLEASGFFEPDAAARRDLTEWSLEQLGAIAVLNRLPHGQKTKAIGAMQGALPNLDRKKRGERYVPQIVTPTHSKAQVQDAARAMMRATDEVEERADGSFTVQTDRAFGFLKGKWLEVLVYNKVRQALKGSGCEVMMGVELARGTRMNASQTGGEIDVAVFRDGRLVAIECKAVSGGEGQHGAMLKLSAYRTELCGRTTPCFVVAPLLYPDSEFDHIRKQAEQLQNTAMDLTVTPLLGWADTMNAARRVRDAFAP
jgi:Holliday junction resolvase-like predicted endonuclease